MTYLELYRFLIRKPYRYNHILNALEDFSSLIPYERFSRPIYIDLVGTNSYVTYFGIRDLQSFYQDRKFLRSHLSLVEAKLKHPEFFI